MGQCVKASLYLPSCPMGFCWQTRLVPECSETCHKSAPGLLKAAQSAVRVIADGLLAYGKE